MKKFLYNITQYNKKAILLILLICISISVQGRNLHQPDSLQVIQSSTTKNGNFFKKIVKFVNKQLEQDSFYVQPNKYNMTIMPQYTYGYEYYRFATENKDFFFLIDFSVSIILKDFLQEESKVKDEFIFLR